MKSISVSTVVQNPSLLVRRNGTDYLLGYEVKGIFDTGTSFSGISNQLVKVLRLKPTDDPVKDISMNGSHYFAHTYIVNLDIGGRVVYENAKVIDLPMDPKKMLIGLDVICRSKIIMGPTEDGRFLFRIQMPSSL